MPLQRIKPLKEKFKDFEAEIVRLVNQKGQHKTAETLGMSVATVNKWLKDNGYRKKIVYFKKESA